MVRQLRGCAGGIGQDLEAAARTAVLNAGDGLHSHPSQALLDLFTLARHFNPDTPTLEALAGKRIVIVGDVLHSRVARSNLWSLTACGVDVVLCGPVSLLPDAFSQFTQAPRLARRRIWWRSAAVCASSATSIVPLRVLMR